MEEKRFNPKNLDRLNNENRYITLPPEYILGKVGLVNPEVIIDLGAGTGFYSMPIAKKYKEATIYACDISEIMVDWMKENILPIHENIVPLKMEDNSISLDSNIADFVLMINLHHELDSPEKTLKECHRLLKSKGKIAISDWKKEKTEQGPPMQLRYEPDQVQKQLIEAGFYGVSIFTELQNNFLVIAEKK